MKRKDIDRKFNESSLEEKEEKEEKEEEMVLEESRKERKSAGENKIKQK